jgi:DNA-binding NarL/FixJ family response regulator
MENLTLEHKRPGTKTLSNIVYYNDDHSKSPVCTGELSEINGATWTLPSTWQELTHEIEQGEDKIVFHIDMITKSGESIRSFVRSLNILTKFMPGHKPLKIVVLIKPSTTQQQVKELKDAKILGIGYDVTYYSYEQAAESTSALIAGTPYWPKDIIDQLPSQLKRSLHIYFRDDSDSEVALQLKKQIMKGVVDVNVRHCKSFSELSDALHDEPASISFHIDMVRRHGGTISEFMMMLETMMKYNNLTVNPNICVAIEADTHVSTIKELQKHKILGIIPGARTIGVEYTRTAIKDIINKIPHWPKDVIARLPGNENKIKNKTSHSLTGRQQEVFDLIANRGLSNKQIARVLNISESTVKIHVSAVMKNLCVRNRTQLALTK